MMTRGPWTKPLAFSGNTDHVKLIHYFVDFTNVIIIRAFIRRTISASELNLRRR